MAMNIFLLCLWITSFLLATGTDTPHDTSDAVHTADVKPDQTSEKPFLEEIFSQLLDVKAGIKEDFPGDSEATEEPLPKDADEKAYQTRILDLVKEIKSLFLESCAKQQSRMLLNHEILKQKAESNSFLALDFEKKSKQLSYRGAVELVSNELNGLLPNRRVVPVFVSLRNRPPVGNYPAIDQHAIPSGENIVEVAKEARKGELNHRGTISVESMAAAWWHSGKRAQFRYLTLSAPLRMSSSEEYGKAFSETLSTFSLRGDDDETSRKTEEPEAAADENKTFGESKKPVFAADDSNTSTKGEKSVVVVAVYLGARPDMRRPPATELTFSSKMAAAQGLLAMSPPTEEWSTFWKNLKNEFEICNAAIAPKALTTVVDGLQVATLPFPLPSVNFPMTPFWRDELLAIYIKMDRSRYGHHQYVSPDKKILQNIVTLASEHAKEGGQFATFTSKVTSDSPITSFKKKTASLKAVVKTARQEFSKTANIDSFKMFSGHFDKVVKEIHSRLVNDIFVQSAHKFPYMLVIISVCHIGKTC